MGGASVRIANKFKTTLSIYYKASGGKINTAKSEIYGWNIDKRTLTKISQKLDMKAKENWETFKYLGLPISLGNSKGRHWQEMLDKLQRKINCWGGRWMNKAGKLILLNTVLSALPIYQFSALLAPKYVCNNMAKLLRDFLWEGGKDNQGKFHLLNWNTILRSKQEGGLQIRDPFLVNKALGGKILWQILDSKSHWVYQTIRRKYLNGLNLKSLAKGTQMWNLCNSILPSLKKDLYMIPGNGGKTLI